LVYTKIQGLTPSFTLPQERAGVAGGVASFGGDSSPLVDSFPATTTILENLNLLRRQTLDSIHLLQLKEAKERGLGRLCADRHRQHWGEGLFLLADALQAVRWGRTKLNP